jgi:putative membrane protein
MLELLAFATLGVGMGVFTGMIPGVHVNNLTPMLVGLAASSVLAPMNAIALIVAMMLTHTFIDYIPSTFLGVPEEDTALTVLPAHRMVLEGKGYEAIRLTALGSLGALMLSAALVGPLLLVIGPAYEAMNPHMHWLLLGIIAVMIALECKPEAMLWAVAIFLLSGFLGILTLDTNLGAGDGAMMPLLGGLFGMSVLLISMKGISSFPEQQVTEEPIELRPTIKAVCTGTSAGILTGIIPGVGPAQGTVLTQVVTRSGGTRDFLVGVSGVNTAKALLSFVALYAIGRPRSGAAVAVSEIIDVGANELLLLIGIALFAGGLATIFHLRLGKLAAKHIQRLPYRAMCAAVMASMVGLSLYYAGLVGLLILATATAIGLLPAAVGVKRTHCMGAIMLPCILYFAGVKDVVLAALGL